MNTSMKTAPRSALTLGDLVLAVSSCTRNSREAALAIADLLQSRRVILGQPRMHRRGH